jgi:NAD(P)-dependent dehydrogenase (short-subunit alcohol dehydrogenase family)
MYQEMQRLDGRVAVVTGGNGNIGRECARALAEWGARVVVCDVNDDLTARAVASMAEHGFEARGWSFDVCDLASIRRAAAGIHAEFGRIDILVANAGIVRNVVAEDMTPPDWNDVIDINLSGVFWCNQSFGKYMLEQGSGTIVNISSIASVLSLYPQAQASYNASKAGVNLLTRSLAGEWALRGVRVNAVAPTYIETAMTRRGVSEGWGQAWLDRTPMKRMGQPSEIAAVVHFLASDAASLLTGSIVMADGGYSSW